MSNKAYSYTGKFGIQYKNLLNPQIATGYPFSIAPYKVNENGELEDYPLPIINATDINWGGATINDNEINTTEDLLYLISQKGTGNDEINIDGDSALLVMLQAIRALQAEVLKLRNSFEGGITSLKESDTAISSVVRKYNYIDEQEPLWATDESELSLIEGFNYDNLESVGLIGDYELSENKDYAIIYNAYWEDANDIIKGTSDAKLYLYLTVNDLKGQITCKNLDDDTEFTINLRSLKSTNNIIQSQNGVYNILIILSRKNLVKNVFYGKNYIWCNIAEYLSSDSLGTGYISLESDEFSEEPIEIDKRLYFHKILFNDIELHKLDIYSKLLDSTTQVEAASVENPNDLKYEAAHITIRSVSTYAKLKALEDQLLEDELIWCKENSKLYIITDHKLKNISVSSGGDEPEIPDNPDNPDNPQPSETMTIDEILQLFIERGIISITEDPLDATKDKYTINNLEAVKFINSETGKTFNFTVDAYGDLRSEEFNIDEFLETTVNKLITSGVFDTYVKHINRKIISNGERVQASLPDVRGFVAGLKNALATNKKNETNSFGIDADRIKIGSIYAPLDTDSKIGCSHAFVELENTSNKDFPLDGCYLHFARPISNNGEMKVSHLALKGKIPANGTYLIRGKQYRDFDDPNVYIKVKTFDQEWYDYKVVDGKTIPELIDFTIVSGVSINENTPSVCDPCYALTYQYKDLTFTNTLVAANKQDIYEGTSSTKIATSNNTTDFPYVYDWRFIDAIAINSITNCKWVIGQGNFVKKPNSIYKNMFELDPAKQAYNSLNKKDSSRSRFQNNATDLQTLELNNEYIYFPKNPEIMKPVSLYTPKASFEYKNVQTDKTKLNVNKPNAVTVSFGTNIFKTRCFNWVSCGSFDEYVFLYDKDGNFVDKFESYKKVSDDSLVTAYNENTNYPKRKEFPQNVNNSVYTSWDYDRLYNYFPADGSYYTSHKCIIDICESAPSTPETWSYKVARLDKDGVSPNPNYCSDEMHFTMYPSSYEAKIYQTTDQQGFHWQEYQVWGACANKLNDTIRTECEGNDVIPILINTGDMTQSGARVSEWLDYYNAGHALFDHLEQMNIVGNNDLAPCNVNEIGTGDDADKSNAYFYHVFYCYEVNPIYLTADTNKENPIYPIINNVYIPSFYYIDIKDIRLLFLNSEITLTTCKNWYKTSYSVEQAIAYNKNLTGAVKADDPKTIEQVNAYNATLKDAVKSGDEIESGGQYTEETANEHNATLDGAFNINTPYTTDEANLYNAILEGALPLSPIVVNVYTGYGIDTNIYYADKLGFTTIYTMLYHMTEDTSKGYIAICHEMPYTVITRDSLSWNASTENGQISVYRSLSNKNALIGCHMNQIDKLDTKLGIYWFSRLLEFRKIKLCLGGHKHTYCVTYPVAENYKYNDGTNKWSLIDGPMPMYETLNTNIEKSVKWIWGKGEEKMRTIDATTGIVIEKSEVNHTKTPLVIVSTEELTTRYPNSYTAKLIKDNELQENQSKEENCLINDKYMYEQDITSYHASATTNENIFLPCHIVSETWAESHNISPVIYFMCQATGYKLTSNKELPTPKQRFSILVPKTDDTGKSDAANANQKNPMYSVITLNNANKTYSLELVRVRGIFNDTNPFSLGTAIKGFKFNQQDYGKKPINLQYTKLGTLSIDNAFNPEYNYGEFLNSQTNLFTNYNL